MKLEGAHIFSSPNICLSLARLPILLLNLLRANSTPYTEHGHVCMNVFAYMCSFVFVSVYSLLVCVFVCVCGLMVTMLRSLSLDRHELYIIFA